VLASARRRCGCACGERGWEEGGGGKATLLQGQAGDGAEEECEAQITFFKSRPHRNSCCTPVPRCLPTCSSLEPSLSSLQSLFHFINKKLASFSQQRYWSTAHELGVKGGNSCSLASPLRPPASSLSRDGSSRSTGAHIQEAPVLCQGHTGSKEPDRKSSATSGSGLVFFFCCLPCISGQ